MSQWSNILNLFPTVDLGIDDPPAVNQNKGYMLRVFKWSFPTEMLRVFKSSFRTEHGNVPENRRVM